MRLDIPTLLVAVGAVTSVVALLLIHYSRTRQTYPGFDAWVGAATLLAAGYWLFALRGPIPAPLSVALANGAFAVAAVWRLSGARQFLDEPRMPLAWWALPPAAIATVMGLYALGVEASSRNLVMVVSLGAPSTGAAASFLRASGPPEDRTLHRFTGGLLAAFVALLVSRGIAWSVLPVRVQPWQPAFLLVASLLDLGWNVIFLMLNSQRLERDLRESRSQLGRTGEELREALGEVKTLGGLLPICSSCKKVRDDDGYWQQIERFVSERLEARFSHGICPECAERLYPEAAARLRARTGSKDSEG